MVVTTIYTLRSSSLVHQALTPPHFHQMLSPASLVPTAALVSTTASLAPPLGTLLLAPSELINPFASCHYITETRYVAFIDDELMYYMRLDAPGSHFEFPMWNLMHFHF